MIAETENQTELLKSTLPLSIDQIRECAWNGVVILNERMLLASIRESQQHRNYYHCRVVGLDASETKRPVCANGVGFMMDLLLQHHGAKCSDLKWEKADQIMTREVGEIVYFLRAGDFIKIGKSTGSPYGRIAQLKTGCPFQIKIAATMPGGIKKERKLHERFSKIRAHGEWFHAKPELLSFIQSIKGYV